MKETKKTTKKKATTRPVAAKVQDLGCAWCGHELAGDQVRLRREGKEVGWHLGPCAREDAMFPDQIYPDSQFETLLEAIRSRGSGRIG